MELKFKQQQYQVNAALSVVNCFHGQQKGFRKETVGRTITDMGMFESKVEINEIFSNKKFELIEDDILKNVKEVQKEQGLKESEILLGNQVPQFSIEMETGTGKTYVYTKTMYELNKEYGWSKFIVLVPSVAIREGVHKSLEITEKHFHEMYGKKVRFFIYNTQNKSNLVNIKSFANTTNIEVIIMNYQAFATKSQESRKIYQKLDSLQSEKPIDIIKRARPILIIDEPQRFGQQAEGLLNEFNPLFVLRYSATHRPEQVYNKIYRLDAIDAYNQKLVKKINVKGIEVVGNSGTNSYIFLDRIQISPKEYPVAYMEIEVNQKSGPVKKVLKIKGKDDLFTLSNNMAQYKGFVVKEDGINGLKNTVSFINGIEIGVGQSIGDVDEEHVRRIQIRETIKSHLEKERILFSKGIKVLSLFFIDEVAKYRRYDKNNNQIKGVYAEIFEQEYASAIKEQSLFHSEYNKYNEYNEYINSHSAQEIHKGYFSIDKKGRFVDSKEKKVEEGSDDVSAYDLIMKNKEKLLSFNEPTRFIFSHSALREGWDNPNVFQICTLKHAQAEISKRQEIGRGLRICVNKDGERMDEKVLENEFFDINKLTVVASESYDNFARTLQSEIVKSLSERPIILTTEVLKDKVLTNQKGEKFTLNSKSAMDLIFNFREKGYVDKDYKITEKLNSDIKDKKFELPKELDNFKDSVIELMQKIYDTANFKATTNEKEDNVSETVLEPNENFAKKEFQDLWKKIKVKTVYEVDFKSEELIQKSVNAIDDDLIIKKVKIKVEEGEQREKLDEHSLKSSESMKKVMSKIDEADTLLGNVKYDLIDEITKETKLTRKTIVQILQKIKKETFHKFQVNPESFIKEVSKIINREKATTLINNIVYSKINDTYEDQIFTINNFKGSLSKNIQKVKKHIYDYLKTDSDIERNFANNLEIGEILVYAKLPNGFKIPTPVGSYNPDWAIVFNTNKFKYLYFIAETKGSMDSLQLKEVEKKKIGYAKKHFEALGHQDIKYDMVNNYDELLNLVMK
ncbi:MAG: DEAD/DEAH box helicase family protein [Leptospiraceae bacterium]|nr:DEAD/DEAH box helicase family protein [Leptospiraceae bacterium]